MITTPVESTLASKLAHTPLSIVPRRQAKVRKAHPHCRACKRAQGRRFLFERTDYGTSCRLFWLYVLCDECKRLAIFS